MRFWREIVNDRLSGGAICVLLMLTFVVQVALAGRASAAMVAPDPASVICTISPEGAHRPTEPGRHQECPCAELCCAGVHLSASLSPANAAGIPIRFADRIEIAVDPSAPLFAKPALRQASARGPPSVSIAS